MKRSSRFWSPDYDTSLVIISQKLVQWLWDCWIISNKISEIVRCSQKALQLFADIFSNELPKEPADIPPFNLIVDDTKWKVSKNRAQSSVKQTALFNTIQTFISQGIVEKSQSPHYSQIRMVPKPDGTFRMCVDYRALNDCTAVASWPIPNIAEMLRRIGSQNQKSLVSWTLHKDTIKLL